MKRMMWFTSALSLAIGIIGVNYFVNEPTKKTNAANEETYSTLALKAKSYYEISSEGAPFYLTFGSKNGTTSLELGRFTYLLKELVYTKGEDSDCGSFISDTTNISSFADLTNRSPWSDEAINVLSTPNTFLSLIAYRNSDTDEETSFIVRKGVDDYTQTSGGTLKANITSDSQFGLYFSGTKVSLSFISLYEYGENFTLHYLSGVEVKEDSTQISPTVNLDSNVSLYTSSLDTAITGSLYFNGYSLITFTMKESTPENIISLKNVKVNGEEVKDLDIKRDGMIYYFSLVLKATDVVSISSSTQVIHIDTDLSIYDLVDISGEKSVSFTKIAESGEGLGNIPNKPNTAFRFLFHTPTANWNGEAQTKFGIYSSNSSLWSNFGYILRMAEGNVTLLTGEEVLLDSEDNPSIASSSTIKVEIGLKKVYDENNHYFANYLYVNVNDVLAAHYTDTKLSTLGSLITKPYIGNSNGVCSFEDCRSADLLSITDSSKKEEITLSYPPYFVKGSDVKISLIPSIGNEIISFKVNETETSLVRDGNLFVATIDSPTNDLIISYSLLPNATKSLSVENSDDCTALYSSSIAYGAATDIVFTPKRGKIFSSVSVKEGDSTATENVNNLVRDGDKFTLTLNAIYKDTEVSFTLIDASFSATKDNGATSYDVTFSSTNILAGGSLSFIVSPNEGYEISEVYVNGALTVESNDAYQIDNVYENIVVKAITTKSSATTIAPAKEDNTLGIVLISISSALFLGIIILAIVLILKNRKKGEKC